MTGASVNFKAVKSAGHAVSHASREVAPTYLLPYDKSMGTVVLLDDKGKVSQVLEAKMALASPRAKVDQRYSPVWEGILNLRRPEPGEDAEEYLAECSAVVTDWYKQYEAATGHKVLRVDVHLDEGHMVDGEAVLNAHAHIIADRTNDLGRVIKLSPKQLRELQTMTSEVTSLERGKSSFETGRKHISHQAYKHLAERGRLETQQVKVKLEKEKGNTSRIQKLFAADTPIISNLKAEIAQLKAQYDQDRATLKASGEATQKDYQALKKERDDALVALKESNQKVETMTTQITQLTDEKAQLEAQAAKWAAKTAHRDAELAKGVPWTEIDTTDVVAPDPRTSQSNTMTPAPVVPLGPNARARLRAEQMALEAARTAQEPPKQPAAPIAPPEPEKQPVDPFKRLRESWDRMVGWIKALGAEQEPVTANSRHDGPVKQLDDLHCVQKTGYRYAVHRLVDLDKVPKLDDPKMVIRYKDGKGTVEGKTGPGVQI